MEAELGRIDGVLASQAVRTHVIEGRQTLDRMSEGTSLEQPKMSWKFATWFAKPRLRIRSMLVLVALVAACLAGWREYWSPRHIWRRAIHAPRIERIEYTNIFGHPNDPPRHVFEWSVIWPIHKLRISGLDESESLEELELAMSDPDVSIREEVYKLVANESASMTPTIAIRLLARGLEDRDEIVRLNAVRGLEPFILPGDPLARKFFGMLDDPSPLVRQYAVSPICAVIARAPDPCTPSRAHLIAAVLSRLDDPDPSVQVATIEATEYLFGYDARLTDTGSARVVGAAILDALQAKTDDPRRGIRGMAAFVLASHGRGLELVPMLIELANHPHGPLEGPSGPPAPGWGSRWPVRSLALLADRSDEAASYLFGRLINIDTGNPSGAWRVLVKIASRSPEARSRIERLAIQRLATRHRYVQAQLALILQEIGSSHDVLPELLEGILHSEDHIRRDTIQALKARLAFDSRVLPRLREATTNPIEYNAGLAAKALEEVESMPAPPIPGAER
jgi:hypothetical protein